MNHIAFSTIGLALLANCANAQPKKDAHSYLYHTKTPKEIRQLENKIDKLYYLLCGEFSNAQQASTATHPSLAVAQNVICVPIWAERKGEYWIYRGWYKQGQPEQALAQGIYRLTKESRDTFKLTFYLLPNEKENNYYSLEWLKKNPFGDLRPKDLVFNEGCTNYVVATAPDEFQILGDEEPCYRAASEILQYYDLRDRLTPEAIYRHSQYYDKNKQLVIDYQAIGGMMLLRRDKNEPLYADWARKKRRPH